jgi:hypothetical protein
MAEQSGTTETRPVAFTEDRVPLSGIEENIEELVELYGGEVTSSAAGQRRFVLPLRRGMAAGGGVECTVSWAAEDTVTLTCNRDVDAPKAQRVMLLVVGVVGSILFLLWPFFGKGSQFGAVAWMGGAVALAVYFLTLRRSSGGLAYDFLRRLADRQRAAAGMAAGAIGE